MAERAVGRTSRRVGLALALAGAMGISALSLPGVSADLTPTPELMPSGLVAENAYEAQVMALATGESVEDLSQRTESSQVFANPDGTWTLKDFLGDNWVKTGGDGSALDDWSAIDLTLEVGADGLVRPSVYSGSITLTPGGDRTDTILTTEIGDSEVVLTVVWDGSKLPAVVLDGARATYPDVWPGVDYVIDVRTTGFEQYFVFKTRAAAIARSDDTFLDVGVEGGTLVEEEGGGIAILDTAGTPVGLVPVATAWDAVDDDKHTSPVLLPWSAEPHLSAGIKIPTAWAPKSVREAVEQATVGILDPEVNPVGISVSSTARGTRLNLDVDEAWLTDPATTYPVVVDPTTDGMWASYDTYVRSSYPDNNYGTLTEIRIGTADDGDTKSRSYLAFDTTVMKSRDIISAYLGLWNYWSPTCTPNPWYAYWTAPPDASTTWNNPPAYRSTVAVGSTATRGFSTTPSCAAGWVTIDITPFALAWKDRPENSQGLFLTTGDETLTARWKRFYSLESSSLNKPHVNYSFNRVPAAPAVASIAVDGLALTEHRVSSVARPVVSATVTDEDGGVLQAFFTVKQGGIIVVDSLPGSKVASGSVSTATLPYALASNVEHTLEVQVSDARVMGAATTPTATFSGPAASGRDLSPEWDDETGVAS